MKISELIDDPDKLKTYSISELEGIITRLNQLSETPSRNFLIVEAQKQIELRRKEGYRNSSYNGSDMQEKIHVCANMIESLRGHAIHHRKEIDPEVFKSLMSSFDTLITSFNDVACDIRTNNFPCDCGK